MKDTEAGELGTMRSAGISLSRRSMLVGVLALVPVACLPGKTRHRGRLTLNIDMPEGLCSGTGVTETICQGRIPWLPGGDALTYSTVGTPIVVTTARGDLIVSLSPLSLLETAARFVAQADDVRKTLLAGGPDAIRVINRRKIGLTLGPTDLAGEDAMSLRNYISSTTFRARSETDTNTVLRYFLRQPSFMTRVTERTMEIAPSSGDAPAVILDLVDLADLSLTLGPGARLRSLIVETTDDKVT